MEHNQNLGGDPYLRRVGCPPYTAELCFTLVEVDRKNNLNKIDLHMLSLANGFWLLSGEEMKSVRWGHWEALQYSVA